jgi:hypothetical protein
MAAPDAPTQLSLTTDGLNRAGYSNPTSSQLTTADGYLEEIKNDIVNIECRLTSLQSVAVLITTNGQSRYALPTDFLSDLTIKRLDGTLFGVAQAGAVGSITLAADDVQEEGDIIGTEILVYSGTGKGSMSQTTSFSSSTKQAGVTPDFTTAPAASSGYIIVSSYKDLTLNASWDFDKNITTPSQDAPTHFTPIGDADNGEIIIWPTPYRSSAIPWGLQLRYYADLMELDLTSTLMATLYKKWRNIWVMGVKYKQYEADDDDRVESAKGDYFGAIQMMIAREKYGYDLSNLNASVRNY